MILADENIARAVVERLREDGIDVAWIAEAAPAAVDFDVLRIAFREGRVLLTDDKDFGELVIREGRPHRGVVLARLAGLPMAERCEILSGLFQTLGSRLVDAFTVVDRDGRVRFRSGATIR